MEKLIWRNEKRKLGDLIPWERNPRYIKNAAAERLVESHDDFGQVETIAIGPNNELYNGHQRLSVWAGEYGLDFEVDVRVSNRVLTEKEREKLTVFLHKGAIGDFDMDELANSFDMDELLTWGFNDRELGINTEPDDVDELWKGMPEFEQEEQKPYHTIKVHFASDEDIEAFATLVGQTVTNKSTHIWFPKLERENLLLYRCSDEGDK